VKSGIEMVTKVLCVAEKPSIAKAVANHLSGNQVNVVRKPMLLTSSHTLTALSAIYRATHSSRTMNSNTTSQPGAHAMSR